MKFWEGVIKEKNFLSKKMFCFLGPELQNLHFKCSLKFKI